MLLLVVHGFSPRIPSPSTRFLFPEDEKLSSKTSIEKFSRLSNGLFSEPVITDDSIERMDNNNVKNGPLSMSISELAEAIGGIGRARVAWDLYTLGVDPQKYFQPADTNVKDVGTFLDSCLHELEKIPEKGGEGRIYEVHDQIQNLRAARRKDQKLGKDALGQLKKLYPNGVEGGIASLSEMSTSTDGTTKLLIRLQDGLEVETVIIPWFDRNKSTLCVSSQVGCKQGCTFCATGRMGKLRSLTTDEIMAQIFYANKIIRISCNDSVTKETTDSNASFQTLPPIDNVVFMGMGEPADNHEAVTKAVNLLVDRNLFQLSANKITVSTIAPTPESFSHFSDAPCVLAWSVHAVDDKLRKELVPTTQYTMDELKEGLVKVLASRSLNLRATMLEVVLIKGLNDGTKEALQLAKFTKDILKKVKLESGDDSDIKIMVNLIPFNDIGHPTFKKPSNDSVLKFQNVLLTEKVFTHIRTTRGDEESAACGQLATKKLKV